MMIIAFDYKFLYIFLLFFFLGEYPSGFNWNSSQKNTKKSYLEGGTHLCEYIAPEPCKSFRCRYSSSIYPIYESNRIYFGRDSNWKRYITSIIDALEKNVDLKIFSLFKSKDYNELNFIKISFCHDILFTESLVKKVNQITIPVHIPMEIKDPEFFLNFKVPTYVDSKSILNYSHFPRVKNFRKSLALITFEPYQRVMTFAIEQCLVSSIWYLELIHCMFIAIIPFLTGLVLSYTLQDIVGSAISTINYSENFTTENCHQAVLLFIDDQISPHYIEICSKMKSCLLSRSFQNHSFLQKREFDIRIKKAYNFIRPIPELMNPHEFFKYSISLSNSYIKKQNFNLRKFPERNFLPIRISLTSLAYYSIFSVLEWKRKTEKEIVFFFAKIITKLIFVPSFIFLQKCSEELFIFSGERNADRLIIIEYFCKEIFSSGFIIEATYIMSNNTNLFLKAISPQRVLDINYPSIVPNMIDELNLEEYDTSWINTQININSNSNIFKRSFPLQKLYNSKKKERLNRNTKYNQIFLLNKPSSKLNKTKIIKNIKCTLKKKNKMKGFIK